MLNYSTIDSLNYSKDENSFCPIMFFSIQSRIRFHDWSRFGAEHPEEYRVLVHPRWVARINSEHRRVLTEMGYTVYRGNAREGNAPRTRFARRWRANQRSHTARVHVFHGWHLGVQHSSGARRHATYHDRRHASGDQRERPDFDSAATRDRMVEAFLAETEERKERGSEREWK